jgi:hypothetical protein
MKGASSGSDQSSNNKASDNRAGSAGVLDVTIGIVTHVSFEFRGGYDFSRAASGCVLSDDVVGSCGEVIITSHADSCKQSGSMH